MNTKIYALLILLIMTLSARAQDSTFVKRNEMSVNVGTFFHVMDPDTGDTDDFSPTFSLGYMRRINRVWSVGATFTFLKENEEDHMYYDNEGVIEDYVFFDRFKYFVLMGTVKASWARHRRWNFYSRVGIGPLMDIHDGNINRNNLEFAFSYHAAPLGFEIGSSSIRAFAEVGFGIQGIMNAGLAYRF